MTGVHSYSQHPGRGRILPRKLAYNFFFFGSAGNESPGLQTTTQPSNYIFSHTAVRVQFSTREENSCCLSHTAASPSLQWPLDTAISLYRTFFLSLTGSWPPRPCVQVAASWSKYGDPFPGHPRWRLTIPSAEVQNACADVTLK